MPVLREFHVLRDLVARLARERRGNLAIVAAILILPLMAIVAVAIDYSNAADAREKLMAAANAAAGEAVEAAALAAAQDPNASFADAEAAGLKRFAERAANAGPVTLNPVLVKVGRSGLALTAVVQYAGVYNTFVSSLVGMSTVPVNGTGMSTLTIGPHADLRVLIDTSASMLVPATPGGAAALAKLTTPAALADYDIDRKILDTHVWSAPNGCAVACHWSAAGHDFYGASRKNNIVLRLDQLKAAVQSLAAGIAARNAARPGEASVRVGLYSFSTGLAELSPPAASAKSAGEVAGSIAPGLWPEQALGHDTDIVQAIETTARDYLPQAGDGSTADAPRQFVLLLTDGMQDVPDGNGGRKTSPLDPAACAPLKRKGATVFVLRTAYANPASPSKTQDTLLDAALHGCASNPSTYFSVDTQADMDAAVAAILVQVAPPPAAPEAGSGAESPAPEKPPQAQLNQAQLNPAQRNPAQRNPAQLTQSQPTQEKPNQAAPAQTAQ